MFRFSMYIVLLVFSMAVPAKTRVIFVNGLSNSRAESYRSSQKLELVIGSSWASGQLARRDLYVEYHSSPAASLLADGIETLVPALNNQTAIACARQMGNFPAIGYQSYVSCLGQTYAAGIAKYSSDENGSVTYGVVRDLSDRLLLEAQAGTKVIVVAHSRGNYVAEAANAYVRHLGPGYASLLDQRVRFVGAATLSASFPGQYISLKQDRALDTHETSALAGVYTVPMVDRSLDACLSPSIDPGLCASSLLSLDLLIHSFTDVYLSEFSGGLPFPIKKYLSDLVRDAYRELNPAELPTIANY